MKPHILCACVWALAAVVIALTLPTRPAHPAEPVAAAKGSAGAAGPETKAAVTMQAIGAAAPIGSSHAGEDIRKEGRHH